MRAIEQLAGVAGRVLYYALCKCTYHLLRSMCRQKWSSSHSASHVKICHSVVKIFHLFIKWVCMCRSCHGKEKTTKFYCGWNGSVMAGSWEAQ